MQQPHVRRPRIVDGRTGDWTRRVVVLLKINGVQWTKSQAQPATPSQASRDEVEGIELVAERLLRSQ